MPSTIFLRFNTRHDNIGDQLIFFYLYEELRKYGDVHIVTSCPKFMNLRILRARESLFIALKDHLLKQNGIFFVEPPGARFIAKTPHIRPVRKTNAINYFWKLLNTKFLLFGVSFDPKMDLHECRNYSFLGVRDHLSLHATKSQHLSQAEYCPDMAFLMPQNAKQFSTGQTALVSFRRETPDVGEHHFADALEKSLPAVFEAIAPVVSDFKIYHQVIEDLEFNSEIAHSYAGAYPVNFMKELPTVHDLSTLSLNCSVAISNRLHVLLPAIAAGALPIALISSKHYKIKSIFETLGMGDCLVYIDEEHQKSVSDQIHSIIKSAAFIVQRNNEIFATQSQLARKIIRGRFDLGKTK